MSCVPSLTLIIAVMLVSYVYSDSAGRIDYNPEVFSPNDPLLIPKPVDNLNEGCIKKWINNGRVFMKWLVRLLIKRSSGTEELGTGSLITTRHILTACDRLLGVEISENHVRAWPIVIDYAIEKGLNFKRGMFPWAVPLGCIPESYLVGEFYLPRGKCTLHGNVPFEDMTNNFAILAIHSQVTVPDWTQWQRMPFDRSLDRTLNLIKWFQNFRKARCQIPRFKKLPGGASLPNAEIEQEGFTYRAMEFATECAKFLCFYHCQDASAPGCETNCIRHEVYKWRGKLFCLKRMHENIRVQRLAKFSMNYDALSNHTDYHLGGKGPAGGLKSEDCENTPVIGAPVVCNGDVIAMVTLCRDEFLGATPIFPIYHQLLRYLPTVFIDAMVFMDGSNKTVSTTREPTKIPDQ